MFELKDVREEYQGSVFCRNSKSIHANSNLLVFSITTVTRPLSAGRIIIVGW